MISYGSERKCYYICDKLCQAKKEKEEVLLLQIFRLLCQFISVQCIYFLLHTKKAVKIKKKMKKNLKMEVVVSNSVMN